MVLAFVTVIIIHGADRATGTSGVVGLGLTSSLLGMNLLFLVYWTPELVWTSETLGFLMVGVLVTVTLSANCM